MSTRTRRQKRTTQKLVDQCMAVAGCLLEADSAAMTGGKEDVIGCLAEAAARLKHLRKQVYKVMQTTKGTGDA